MLQDTTAMDGKGSFIIAKDSVPPKPQNGRRSFMILASFLLVLLWRSSWTSWQLPNSVGGVGTTYAGEKISWEACGEAGGHKLECSSLEVPMDQYNNTQSDKTFKIPLIRLRGENGAKNLFHNVGGPGGSGIEYMQNKGNFLATLVGRGYHILSFDPRGVGGSEPQARCYANPDSKQSLHQVRDFNPIEDSAETYAWTRNFVQSCLDSAGEHGKYINTVQTVADMNSILEAVGQENLIFWGWSYGTILGQTYATLFPDRVERMMIDGVCNNTDWFSGRLSYLHQLVDADTVFEGFFEECFKAGDRCPLAEFAQTQEGLKRKVMDFVDGLEMQPLSVYVNNTHWGTLTKEKVMINAFFTMLYKPTEWSQVAGRLAKMLKGNATEMFLEYGFESRWYTSAEDSNDVVCANDVVTGPQHFPQGRQEILDLMAPALNISHFIPSAVKGIYKRALWKIPKTHDFRQKQIVKTAHPLLIFSSTFDPVTPLIGAESAKAVFFGSEIIELKAYGHGTISLPSGCIAKHVQAYLYNGTVPEKHTFCEIDGTYFEPLYEKAMPQFEDEDERAVYIAQLGLAEDRSVGFPW